MTIMTASSVNAASSLNANGPLISSKENSISSSRRLEPLEVGWQFVQEYYTILNKNPNRLHCFYNKNSVMVHGYEGDTIKPCQGQQEIHKRFKELDLQDSKVVISSVDSLGTLSNGILVTVIGELERKGSAPRKFTQSFVLAEQPNGFYVLNDVFRFLKDQFEELTHNEKEEVVNEEPSPAQDAIEHEDAKEADVIMSHPSEVSEVEHTVEDAVVPEPVVVAAAEPVKVVPVSQKQQETSDVDPAPAPKAPSPPKTWAKLAETDKERWAKHVSETKGQTVAPAVASKSVKKPEQQKEQKPRQEVGDVAVFIRGFSKATKIPHIKEAFGDLVGSVKWVDLVTENSAYVEFADVESVKKALDLKTIEVNGENVTIDDRRSQPPVVRKNRKNQVMKNGGQAIQQQVQKTTKDKSKK